ncbi:hypothetical protein [Catenuloplanes indicus]|uniref:Uncharacterized protein n=1 Tax=Catenuloplanes indicus TaxID=137267 RepID=A0AAE3VT60_9ACTN|nr:hypothetical protein [Catenuloplanes indicus]MDQ0363808.1 hypothetical protein [Catenuloplanes indicus]
MPARDRWVVDPVGGNMNAVQGMPDCFPGSASHAANAPARRTTALGDEPPRPFPSRISRATVAAAMLDEAEHPAYPGRIAIPLER